MCALFIVYYDPGCYKSGHESVTRKCVAHKLETILSLNYWIEKYAL